MRKLTIVVNCTDRKSIKPAADLLARSLPPGSVSERFPIWRRRVETGNPRTKLIDLYMGEAWGQAKALAADAKARGTSVRLVVASAGLGLRDVSEIAPSYAATFASGHADSVTSSPKFLPDWWRQLGALPGACSLSEFAKQPVLLVLSETYARAMDADLVKLSQRDGNHLLVGGWRSIEGLPRLASDRDLRTALGGTVSSLNLRMARRWMADYADTDLYTAESARRWSKWACRARQSENYQRTPMTDAELADVIASLIRNEPTLTATRALRILRSSGNACEQKRFGALFREAAGAG